MVGSFFWPPATYLILLGCVFLMAFPCELREYKVVAARIRQGNNLRHTNIQCIRVSSLYIPTLTLDKIILLSEGSGLTCSCMAWWFQMNDEDNLPNCAALSNLIQAMMKSKHVNILFLLAWKLAGKHEYVCNVHLSKMSSFWLKWVGFCLTRQWRSLFYLLAFCDFILWRCVWIKAAFDFGQPEGRAREDHWGYRHNEDYDPFGVAASFEPAPAAAAINAEVQNAPAVSASSQADAGLEKEPGVESCPHADADMEQLAHQGLVHGGDTARRCRAGPTTGPTKERGRWWAFLPEPFPHVSSEPSHGLDGDGGGPAFSRARPSPALVLNGPWNAMWSPRGARLYGMDLPPVSDSETPVEAHVHVLQVEGSCPPRSRSTPFRPPAIFSCLLLRRLLGVPRRHDLQTGAWGRGKFRMVGCVRGAVCGVCYYIKCPPSNFHYSYEQRFVENRHFVENRYL